MLEQDGLDRGSGVLDESDEPGAGAQVLAAGLSGAPPERVGRYRIIREIGRGGMGVVYEAEQESPARHVARKVIRDAFASPQIHRRFRRESELLGRLQHPGIAHVYEAGVEVVQGRSIPFIAMEFIEGEPLTEHLATATSGRRGLLQLFIRICDGVQHAHQKGVIHRDLKPGNVLVTRASTRLSSVDDSGSQTTADSGGQPKIVDFGIARVSDPDSQATLQTHTGQLVGTLAYMSPEQIEGDPASIDTRCDVYAIGVMLYQVLAGRMPVEISGKPVAEAARLIRESAPTPRCSPPSCPRSTPRSGVISRRSSRPQWSPTANDATRRPLRWEKTSGATSPASPSRPVRRARPTSSPSSPLGTRPSLAAP